MYTQQARATLDLGAIGSTSNEGDEQEEEEEDNNVKNTTDYQINLGFNKIGR